MDIKIARRVMVSISKHEMSLKGVFIVILYSYNLTLFL